MSERKAALLIVLGLAAATTACGGPEHRTVDQYFNALKADDQQTLTSFALVGFDKKVDNWRVRGAEPEERSPAKLPDLIKEVGDVEAKLAKNKKDAQTYNLNNYGDIEKAKELQKANKPIPGSLSKVAEAWKQFNDTDRGLKKALAEAKAAAEKERRNVVLSVGDRDDVESLTGVMVTKKLDLELTIGGQVQPYVMRLKKYELTGGTGRMMAKWVVQSIEPKG